MQIYFFVFKEYLISEVVLGNYRLIEELKDQLKDMKVKYEGVLVEVGKLRN